jgi:putative photosynthetic complex assembly protein
MSHHHEQVVPRWVLVGAAAMMVLTIALAGGARLQRLAAGEPPTPAPVEAIEVRFEDRSDGSIAMLDADSRRELSVVPPGTNGFIRGVLRGMFRERKLESMGRDGRFVLARGADGQLSLEDLQTRRRIGLDSFGSTNSEAFRELLRSGRQASR